MGRRGTTNEFHGHVMGSGVDECPLCTCVTGFSSSSHGCKKSTLQHSWCLFFTFLHDGRIAFHLLSLFLPRVETFVDGTDKNPWHGLFTCLPSICTFLLVRLHGPGHRCFIVLHTRTSLLPLHHPLLVPLVPLPLLLVLVLLPLLLVVHHPILVPPPRLLRWVRSTEGEREKRERRVIPPRPCGAGDPRRHVVGTASTRWRRCAWRRDAPTEETESS